VPRFVAATQTTTGVNARSRPTAGSPKVDRFPEDCAIGFDGYCYGEPITDLLYIGVTDIPQRTDVRWLRVLRNHNPVKQWLARLLSGEPNEDRFVTAARVIAQDPEQELLELEASDCPGGRPSPGQAGLAPFTPASDGSVSLIATGDHTFDMGYAVYVGEDTTGLPFRQVPGTFTDDGAVEHVWRTAATADTLRGPTSVVVAAVPCLAPSVPPRDLASIDLGQVRVDPGAPPLPLPEPPSVDEQTRESLAETACAGIP
jgi:hypothetical protein